MLGSKWRQSRETIGGGGNGKEKTVSFNKYSVGKEKNAPGDGSKEKEG